ncbi:hypothetical protein PsW64_04721 [Pseudovibrio sp. W64]|uniref:hypothetical protein n=1 Tax=Pseudovibrio sp. W64 TaxID=1735583 RepID=UPI0007B1B02D|nr:hypothetical protein [Pseudovibrio sp. W64]KZK76876.1 hypothetical protein PsW64_04721 [Pseudovibrio sp. W64]
MLEGERQGWTLYTFNDLMVVATYHNMVRSHCTNTIAELIAGTVSQQLANKWPDILGTESGVFCLCNNAMDEENLQIEMLVGLEKLWRRSLRLPEAQSANLPIILSIAELCF